MRTAFIERLMELAENDDRIFLVCGDLGYTVLERFSQRYPDRFLNVGVAEQNMTGVATGLALEGYTVFTYSIGNFPTLRCMEQIRYDVCYHRANVKIVAVGGGYAYGPLGTSHHATEELGMLRTIPNLVVCAPGDALEVKAITSLLAEYHGPCYIRLGKAGEANVHAIPPRVQWGKMICVINGRSTVILTTGVMLAQASSFLQREAKEWGLWSVPFIKPIDHASLEEICGNYTRIITVEEHQSAGGLGSAVLEGLNDLVDRCRIRTFPNIRRIAIPDRFATIAGTQQYLWKKMGLEIPNIE